MKTSETASPRGKKGAAGVQAPATRATESRSDEATVIKQRKHRIAKAPDSKNIAAGIKVTVPTPLTGKVEVAPDPGPAELTPERLAQLEKNETVIKKGLETFYEVGLAFAEIRNHKLYQPKFTTFDQYLEERWDLTKQRASQLISAAEGRAALEDAVEHGQLPTTERAWRELLKAPPEKRARIVKLAFKKGGPTTGTIINARAEVLGPVGSKGKTKTDAVITIERALDAFKTATRFLKGVDLTELGKGDRTKLTKAYAALAARMTKLNLEA